MYSCPLLTKVAVTTALPILYSVKKVNSSAFELIKLANCMNIVFYSSDSIVIWNLVSSDISTTVLLTKILYDLTISLSSRFLILRLASPTVMRITQLGQHFLISGLSAGIVNYWWPFRCLTISSLVESVCRSQGQSWGLMLLFVW